ncbi:hypothetical protein GCM10028807_53710 [Spirosoma daeguense]
MTPLDRHELIEKKENGILTDAEHAQYLDLLKNDPTFSDEVATYQLLNDTLQQREDEQLWAAFEDALSEAPIIQKKPFYTVWVQQNPALAVAASLIVCLTLGYIIWVIIQPKEPQLVKLENNYLFPGDTTTSANGQGYSKRDTPIGELPTKWIVNPKQNVVASYIYCHDTLSVFIQNQRDTLYIQDAKLRYDSKEHKLSIERSNKGLFIFDECENSPNPF